MVPADKKLYALRDVTGTVDSIPLIASSIMSKKLAAGADVIVLDVKTGSGAFMKTEEDSVRLAKEMVKIGNNVGRKTLAVISDMDEPLGYAVGNAIEVKEAIDTLNGHGPQDLLELCLTIGSLMAVGTGRAADIDEARKLLLEKLDDGSALRKFAEFVEAQGGDSAPVYNTALLPQASIVKEIYAPFTDEEISAKMVELLTPKGTKAKVEIVYQPLEGLHEACPNYRGDWYFSGNYPTPGGVKMVNQAFINYIEQLYQF